jgi:2-polyprenyl-3-methyl-5-hydroxy-6-metoxy-1,4-benzoquinol methylase
MVMGADRLEGAIELMDLPDADPCELAHTLTDLAWINRWLGGMRLIRAHLPSLLDGTAASLRILDVGTGYADVPRAVARWGRRCGLPVEIEGVDHREQIVRLAQEASAPYPEIRIRRAEALSLPYPEGSFHVVLASLVLHHMEGEDQVQFLRELYRVASHAVLVNDLRRGRWPFLVTWAALHIVSRNRLIHHDGPLSVRRSFLPAELLALARRAGWKQAGVSHHPFFRLALVAEKPQRQTRPENPQSAIQNPK